MARRRARRGGARRGRGFGGTRSVRVMLGNVSNWSSPGGGVDSRPRNGAHRSTRRGGRIRCCRRRSRLRVEDAFSRSTVACGFGGGRGRREGRARTTARSYRSRHSFPCRAAFGLPRGNYWACGGGASRELHFISAGQKWKSAFGSKRRFRSRLSRESYPFDFPTRGCGGGWRRCAACGPPRARPGFPPTPTALRRRAT